MKKHTEKDKLTALYERYPMTTSSRESVSIENQELLCKGVDTHSLIHMTAGFICGKMVHCSCKKAVER